MAAISITTLKKQEVKKLSWEEIFLTHEYANSLRNSINTVCSMVGYKGIPPMLKMFSDEESSHKSLLPSR